MLPRKFPTVIARLDWEALGDKGDPLDKVIDYSSTIPRSTGNTPPREGGLAYGLAGRCRRQLALSTYRVGSYCVTWDGRDDTNRTVASGSHVARLESECSLCTGMLTLAR